MHAWISNIILHKSTLGVSSVLNLQKTRRTCLSISTYCDNLVSIPFLGMGTLVWGILWTFPVSYACIINLIYKVFCAADFTAEAQRSPIVFQSPCCGWFSILPFSFDLNRWTWVSQTHPVFIMMDWHSQHQLSLNGSERVLMTWLPGCQPPHTQTYCESKDWS